MAKDEAEEYRQKAKEKQIAEQNFGFKSGLEKTKQFKNIVQMTMMY